MAKKAATEEVKDRDKLLNDVLKDIEREYGKGAVMRLGDRAGTDVEPIPSGSLLLDQALGIGGYPKGRIIEIFGPESSGKTTLALHAIAEVQKKRRPRGFYRRRKRDRSGIRAKAWCQYR